MVHLQASSSPTGSGDLPRLGAPAQRALSRAGITTLADLARHTEAEVARLHGMGPKALGVLRAALADRGLAFISPPP
ncbi:hypothetical protein DAETH_41050 (plasmid) [Deinococcus aetherius]|uniref:DNA-binding protein n=1 Tax=Deinococcus aetherius TaxID=200252 RepID=A0ABM8AJZ2_9DEIO|nr:DNA-directed RNA polymerase subunit alpha C-terminal domain-containing protein [Deinococcus aetherius]BDP44136.1 hypothetical protein DAETH_41050 [Deinococcus aetherius]